MADPSRSWRRSAKFGQLTVFLIPIGVATNAIGGQLASVLKLPIFLDATGTILVGALCGGLPGALVGAISNVVNTLTDPTRMVYAVVSVFLGLAAGWFSRAGWFRTLPKTVLTGIPFALIGGLGGGLITLFVFGGFVPSGNGLVVATLHAVGLPIEAAVFVGSLPTDVVDKVVSVVLVFLILQRIPGRLLVKLPLGTQYRRQPLTITGTELASISGDDELAFRR